MPMIFAWSACSAPHMDVDLGIDLDLVHVSPALLGRLQR